MRRFACIVMVGVLVGSSVGWAVLTSAGVQKGEMVGTAHPTNLMTAGQIPVFPGAEGFGAYARGGRGGRVYHVTTLEDGGPGSLRAAVEAEGPRIVVNPDNPADGAQDRNGDGYTNVEEYLNELAIVDL